ncbi:AraC family transcriptional regulator [bacterium]|nr:AraC family transcriptional regulator [bacterium]MCI0606674.1 AraC family transcriptional regulator [bacterium]
MSLERTEYYKGDLLSVRYVACRSAEKGTSDVETSDADTLVLPLRGAFIEHFSHGTQVLAEPNVALIFPAGRSCRVSHPISAEDDCLVVEFSVSCFQEVLEGVLHSSGVTSVGTHSLLSPSAMAVRNLIWRRLKQKMASPLEVEETGVALLSHALLGSRENRMPQRCNSLSRQVETAKVILLLHPEKNWSLHSLALALQCSPFHLTRMFREKVGVPLHRYLLHTRLARAVDLLLDTDKDLTTISLDLGFSSHSHFTASFRQLVGFAPSQLREIASTRIVEETRKILIAPLSKLN